MKKVNELFFYTFEPVINLLAGTGIERSVTCDADSDFILSDIFGVAYPTGTLVNPVLFNFSFRDDVTTKLGMNRLTLSSLVCSNATALNPLPVYRMFRSKATISINIGNVNAAAIDAYISFRGYKVPMGSVSMVNLTGTQK